MSERDDEVEVLVGRIFRQHASTHHRETYRSMLRRAIMAGIELGSHRGAMETIDVHSQSNRQAIAAAKAEGAREENEAICGILEDWGVARRSIELISARRKP